MRARLLLAFVAVAIFSDTPATAVDDVPAREVSLGADLPQVPTQTARTFAFGNGGTVLVCEVQDFRLLARRSTDGGASFGPAAQLAGLGVGPDVLLAEPTQSPDGRVYIALLVAAPDGYFSLQLLWTADLGATWVGPLDVPRGTSPPHIYPFRWSSFSVGANALGRVSIAFPAGLTSEYYVVSSANAGQSWVGPVRVDPRIPPCCRASSISPSSSYRLRTVVDDAGIVHVAYVQYFQYEFTAQPAVVYTRSTDGGASFAPEIGLNGLLRPLPKAAHGVDLAVASDGALLVLITERNNLVVARSTDQGQTFTMTLDWPTPISRLVAPTILVAGASVLVTATDSVSTGRLFAARSTSEHGLAFETPQEIASGVTRESVANARTAAGTWVLCWDDGQPEYFGDTRGKVLATSSVDGGAWASPVRLDAGGGTTGFGRTRRAAIASAGPDDVVVTWADGRQWAHGSRESYFVRGAAASLSFSTDEPLAFPREPANPESYDPVVKTDAAGRVFTAYLAKAPGPEFDVFVQRSLDGGRTFASPVRVSSGAAGERSHSSPRLLAGADNRLFLLYRSAGAAGPELRFKASTDGGAKWPANDSFVTSTAATTSNYQIDEGRPGEVLISFNTGDEAFIARSTDGGATFSTAPLGTVDGIWDTPVLCADGAKVALAVVELPSYAAYGYSSLDGGVSWSSRQWLGPALNGLAIACDGTGRALASWADVGAYVARFDGLSWHQRVALANSYDTGDTLVIPTWIGADSVLVSFENWDSVYVNKSSDAGASFATSTRLDEGSPFVSVHQWSPRAVADGAGNVWVTWADPRVGYFGQPLVRHSGDFGETYGPAFRLTDELPAGTRRVLTLSYSVPAGAALPGAAVFAHAAQRRSQRQAIVVTAFDLDDFDRDGASAAADCADGDPDLLSAPQEVAGVRVDPLGGSARVSWTSQDSTAGRATAYDVVGGSVTALRAAGGYAGASCEAADVPDTPYDAVGSPNSGDATYYLVRADSACGSGTYGDSTAAPDPRDALDLDSPCP